MQILRVIKKNIGQIYKTFYILKITMIFKEFHTCCFMNNKLVNIVSLQNVPLQGKLY